MLKYLPLIIATSTFLIALLAVILVLRRRMRVHGHGIARFTKNPILGPIRGHRWESEAVFNPAAFIDNGRVHLFYRALGRDGVSRIGYASSADGRHFDMRLPYPAFDPSITGGLTDQVRMHHGQRKYSQVFHSSGGGWGGSEDPRIVKIQDKLYMNFINFEGWDSVRIALTSISLEDLAHYRWNWKHPVAISPPRQVNKNWVLFPEKINGRYAILHSISPDILVDYIDDLDHFDGSKHIQSRAPKGGRPEHWDNWVRGAGAPPIKTSRGWLLLYHAMDKKDPNKYKLGAMLLDLTDPTKILYRSHQPILNPDMHYENDWKPGVVYASGAVVKDGTLFIYYGGGDKYVCVAETPLDTLLDWLVEYGKQ